MKLGGVDGCPFGWILIRYDSKGYSGHLYRDFTDLINAHRDLNQILADIPIGLGSRAHPRTIEARMRKALSGQSSSVFNPPCREAVYAENSIEAKQLNLKVEGKSLSQQTLNITNKIKEVDTYLMAKNDPVELIESHPEICFRYLNHGVPLAKKKLEKGREERLSLLHGFDPKLADLYERLDQEYLRRDVGRDDILDALVLCLTAVLGWPNRLSFFADEHPQDAEGIPIRIGYYQHDPVWEC